MCEDDMTDPPVNNCWRPLILGCRRVYSLAVTFIEVQCSSIPIDGLIFILWVYSPEQPIPSSRRDTCEKLQLNRWDDRMSPTFHNLQSHSFYLSKSWVAPFKIELHDTHRASGLSHPPVKFLPLCFGQFSLTRTNDVSKSAPDFSIGFMGMARFLPISSSSASPTSAKSCLNQNVFCSWIMIIILEDYSCRIEWTLSLCHVPAWQSSHSMFNDLYRLALPLVGENLMLRKAKMWWISTSTRDYLN